MQVKYQLPSGDSVWVVDTATAAQHLSTMLTSFSQGGQEPLFYGDEPRPQGVVISFDQWVEYERFKEEAEADQRIEQIVRDRLASGRPEDHRSFEEASREGGWVTFEQLAEEVGLELADPDVPDRAADSKDQR